MDDLILGKVPSIHIAMQSGLLSKRGNIAMDSQWLYVCVTDTGKVKRVPLYDYDPLAPQ